MSGDGNVWKRAKVLFRVPTLQGLPTHLIDPLPPPCSFPHLRVVGQVVGKALHDGQLIDAYFTRSFYKHMLGSPITYEDIEAVDPEYYKNLIWCVAGVWQCGG